jgi:hypothetical protein
VPSGFEDFWPLYPRHVGKADAEAAFSKALTRAPLADILAGARRYAAERAGEDQKYTAYPASWLNGDRWADEPTPKRVERRARAW